MQPERPSSCSSRGCWVSFSPKIILLCLFFFLFIIVVFFLLPCQNSIFVGFCFLHQPLLKRPYCFFFSQYLFFFFCLFLLSFPFFIIASFFQQGFLNIPFLKHKLLSLLWLFYSSFVYVYFYLLFVWKETCLVQAKGCNKTYLKTAIWKGRVLKVRFWTNLSVRFCTNFVPEKAQVGPEPNFQHNQKLRKKLVFPVEFAKFGMLKSKLVQNLAFKIPKSGPDAIKWSKFGGSIVIKWSKLVVMKWSKLMIVVWGHFDLFFVAMSGWHGHSSFCFPICFAVTSHVTKNDIIEVV